MSLPNTDELVRAAELLITTQHGSLAALRRTMRLEAFAAGSILDRLEELGIVGPFEGLRAREVLVSAVDVADALKYVANGRRYVRPTSGVLRAIAHGLVREQMPGDMPRVQRAAVAERVVAALESAGWRPTRT